MSRDLRVQFIREAAGDIMYMAPARSVPQEVSWLGRTVAGPTCAYVRGNGIWQSPCLRMIDCLY